MPIVQNGVVHVRMGDSTLVGSIFADFSYISVMGFTRMALTLAKGFSLFILIIFLFYQIEVLAHV